MSGTTSSGSDTKTGRFQTVNGQIIGPNDNVFTAAGINVFDSQMDDASQILADFSGINFVRLNVYNYQSPSAYASFIQTMTSAGVVVELEDHTNSTGANAGSGVGSAFTGSELTNELNWYSSMASAYASNPDVWFGTDNEPPEAGLSTWEQETYNAIRGTGNNNPILMELPGGGYPVQNVASYGMDPSVYASMSNIVWDVHNYGWVSNYSTNQQDVNSALTGPVQQAQAITSANGTPPVIVGEYGPSTNGQSTDANASEVLQAVQQAAQTGETAGAVAWGWDPGANDDLTDGKGSLTSYGQEVAQWIASTQGTSTSGASNSSETGPTSTPAATPAATSTPAMDPAAPTTLAASATPSANDTVVTARSTAAIVDVNGNQWTIDSAGQLAVNGTPDTTTANVVQLAYVNGTIWQENSSDMWWDESQPSAGSAPQQGTSTSPLPVSPNDTMVLAGSNDAITDTSGNNWTITGSGQVAVNGVTDTMTANVTELAYVNNAIWQENSSGLWWGETQPNAGWAPQQGTSTSPLPAPVTLASGSSSETVTQSQISVAATTGNQMLFMSGSANIVNLTGGADTITDTGAGNTYILPPAGQGSDTFTSNILSSGDTLDLVPALAATNWNGSGSTLANYLSVADSGNNAVLSIAPTSGGAATPIATVTGTNGLNVTTLLAHAIT